MKKGRQDRIAETLTKELNAESHHLEPLLSAVSPSVRALQR